jgi:hypothetical protein
LDPRRALPGPNRESCCQPGAGLGVLIDMKPWTLAAVCCVALAFPAGASAAKCAPPGVSGVNQYFETIPGAKCNQSLPTARPHHPHGGALPGTGSTKSGGGGPLTSSTARQLAAQGGAGQAVAQLVASTGTPAGQSQGRAEASGSHSGGSGGGSGGQASTYRATARGPVSALLHPIVSGSGSTGILLPLFLAGVLVVVLTIVIVRRRVAQ